MKTSKNLSFKGFSFKILLQKNWGKLDTYLKICLSICLAYFISDEIIVQGLVVILGKFLMDIIHFYVFEVKINDKTTLLRKN